MVTVHQDQQVEKETVKNGQKLMEKQEKDHTSDNVRDEGDEEMEENSESKTEQNDGNGKDEEKENGEGLEKKYVKILLTKMYKLKEDDELQNFEADTAEYTKWLVEKWIKRKDIKGVQDTFTTETITDLTNLNLWLSETRKTGKKTVRVEVFFTAEMNVGLRDIIEHDIIELRKENVRLEQKRTSNEHTNKVGYLTGPIVDRVNMHYYDTLVKHLGDIDEGDVEIKKNRVYDGPEDE